MTCKTISHYDVLERLGAGAMGVVYKARDQKLGRIVAIKFLAPHLNDSQSAQERFLREARTVSALNHPNIATLYEAGEEDGELFLAFEYLPKGTLRDRIEELRQSGRKMPLKEVFCCAQAAAAGLAAARQERVLHRDIKPANLMFSGNNMLKITDFGLSKFLEGKDETLSEGRVGTMRYMSPEQARGDELDHRSDIFSVGVVIYEMLAGRPPFAGKPGVGVLRSIIENDPATLATERPDAPPALIQVVERALQKHPDDRYQRADDMLAELIEAEKGLDGSTIDLESSPQRGKRRTTQRRALGVAGILFLTLTLLSPRVRAWISRVAIPEQRQLVVLPFVNIGADQAFCDGLTETITSKLTQLQQFHDSLAVMPASDVREKKIKSAEEARKIFGSNLVLTGSVQRFGDEVKFTLTLSSTQPLRQLRTADITEKWANLVALEDEVTAKVSDMLDLELGGGAKGLLRAGRTSDSIAYRYYLEALGYLRRYDQTGNVDRTISLLNEALKRDPHYVQALIGLSQARIIQYNLTGEAKWLDAARDLAVRAMSTDSRFPGAHLAIGEIYEKTGKYDLAVEEYNRALTLDRLSPEVLRHLASVYETMHRTRDAEALYREVIQHQPYDWWGYNELGYLYYRLGRPADAIHCYEQVVKLTPDNYLPYTNLGSMYIMLGKYSEAEELFRKSISVHPTTEAWSNLGAALFSQEKFWEAAQATQKAVAMGQSDYKSYGNLADCYRWVPDYQSRAVENYEKAIELAKVQAAVNSKDAVALSGIAVYEAKLGRIPTALSYAAKAVAAGDPDWQSLYNEALVYHLAGQTSKALQTIAAAVASGYPMSNLANDPEWANLRRNSRYRNLLSSRPQ